LFVVFLKFTKEKTRAGEAMEARVAADPFVREGIVTAEITGLTPARTDARLGFLKVAE
jgi:hypothetical protein